MTSSRLAELTALLELYEQHRKLIAYEIHDGLAQMLSGCLMKLRLFEAFRQRFPDLPWESLDEGVDLLESGLQEARRLMSGLRPAVLDDLGVIAAVESLVSESRRPGGPRIQCTHRVAFGRLAPPLETAIFRIVQESLTNALRHSQSDRIHIRLVQRANRLHVEVRDWGIGFDPDRVAPGRLGLEGIRERAQLFGGQAGIHSAPGRGTRVVVELPLVEAAPEQTAKS